LGGAALTRRYVEDDCRAAYACGRVAYARDAFEGLAMMEKVVSGRFDDQLAQPKRTRVNGHRRIGQPSLLPRPVDAEEIRLRREELARDVAVPVPPFWGDCLLEAVPV